MGPMEVREDWKVVVRAKPPMKASVRIWRRIIDAEKKCMVVGFRLSFFIVIFSDYRMILLQLCS